MKELRDKIAEALISALPFTAIVYIVAFSLPVTDVACLVKEPEPAQEDQ